MRTLKAGVAALLTATVLVGCQDASGKKADPDPTARPSSADPASSTPPAALGKLMRGKGFTYRLPAGWTVSDSGFNTDTFTVSRLAGTDNSFEVSMVGTTSSYRNVSEMAKGFRSSLDSIADGIRRMPDVTVDGSPAYHQAGTWYGGVVDSFGILGPSTQVVTITFTLEGTHAQAKSTIGTVLDSFQWA